MHANLSLIVFPDSNWYISVVLLYVIAAGVRSNKRYSNLVAYWIEFWLFMFLYLYCIITCVMSSKYATLLWIW